MLRGSTLWHFVCDLTLDVLQTLSHSLTETHWKLNAVGPDSYSVIYLADDLLITKAAGADLITTTVLLWTFNSFFLAYPHIFLSSSVLYLFVAPAELMDDTMFPNE